MADAWVLDPFEALITRAIYVNALSGLGLRFDRDFEAAQVASGFCKVKPQVLNDFNWSRVIIYMPPFREIEADGIVIAVEGYTLRRLLERGVKPDIVVTDFDFEPNNLANYDGLVLGHAHGDNIGLFVKYGKLVKNMIPTVQVWPTTCGILIPGFTDGDRAVYLSAYMGAREIVVRGFNPRVNVKRMDNVKVAKLKLAELFLARASRLTKITVHQD